MTDSSVESIVNGVNTVSIDQKDNTLDDANNDIDCEYSEKWGFTLDELYKLGLQFYKGNFYNFLKHFHY